MKYLTTCLSLILVAGLSGLFTTQLHGQGVTVEVSTLPRVGVSIGGPLGGGVTEIVSADLKRTGMISPVGSGSGDYLATGEASESGVTGRLENKKTGAEVFNQTFSGKGRLAAHQFADAITQAVTGLPGFASSKLAFIANASGSKELYLADMDGFNARAVTHDGTICASPDLSRDGTKIAYTSYKSGYPDVYVINLGSGTRTRIAFFPGINTGPSFSPDGSMIALTLSKDGNPEIYTMSVDGGSLTRITRTRGSETSPSWSPTGDRLVYSSDDRGSPQLFISSATSTSESSDMDHLVTGNSYCTKPDWSPDGKWIAFTARVGGQFQIGVFDVASRTAQLITTSGGQDPAWTRDSRHLVYANNGRLHLLDTISHQSLPIETAVGGCGEPTVSR
ncbi:MAG: biopolymer transporter Tol [Methylacidiphilales bacterium]|nr:biopolymer transporter Tol [Candidatus Methylacidiphilales bacterium]